MSESGRKQREKRFWEFADITVIHGFGYALKASHWVEATLWLVAVGACIGLAVNDLVILVNYYVSQPTTTNINVNFNATGTLTLSNPVVCVDAMLECLYLPTDFTSASSEIFTAFSAAPNSFNLSSLSYQSIATVIRMFSLMGAMEDINLGENYLGKPKTDYPSADLYEKYYNTTTDQNYATYSTVTPLYTLRNNLGKAGVNFTELTWQIGVYICTQLQPLQSAGLSIAGICSRSNITWVGSGALRTEVCMLINSAYFNFTLNNNAVHGIFINNTAPSTAGKGTGSTSGNVGSSQGQTPSGQSGQTPAGSSQLATSTIPGSQAHPSQPGSTPPTNNGRKRRSTTSSNTAYNLTCLAAGISTMAKQVVPLIYFDPNGDRRYSSSSPDWVTSLLPITGGATTVAIAAVYETVSTNANPCSSNDTITECSLRCTQAFFMNSCGCYPVSLFTLTYNKPAKMPFCYALDTAPPNQTAGGVISNISFSSCMAQDFTANPPTQTCLSQCVHECKTTTFISSTSSSGPAPPASLLQNSITISRWLYPDFQQSLVMTPSAFLASFGGSLGVWLGASFISIVHVPIYFLNMALRACGCCAKQKVQLPSGLYSSSF